MIALEIFDGVGSGAHAIDRIAFGPQATLQDVQELLLVFDDQDTHYYMPPFRGFFGRQRTPFGGKLLPKTVANDEMSRS